MGLSGLESLKLLRVLDISIGCHCHGCASQPWDNGNHPLLSSPLFEGVESWVEKLLDHALAREEPCHIYHMNLPLHDAPLFTNIWTKVWHTHDRHFNQVASNWHKEAAWDLEPQYWRHP
jgi:hypothetical protein